VKRVERSRVGQRLIERLRRGGKLGPQNRFKRTAHAPAPAKNEISTTHTHTHGTTHAWRVLFEVGDHRAEALLECLGDVLAEVGTASLALRAPDGVMSTGVRSSSCE
jgi:hypothetical protein